jgi:hypothetical protein
MKTGNLKTLNDMAAELTRRMEAKADFIAPTQKLEALVDGGLMMNGLAASNTPVLAPTDHFRRQVSAHFKVPFEYSERIRAAHPELYARTLNTFFQREPANRMVRTIDGKARAFLSDRYRPLDNHDLMEAILPALLDQPQIQIPSIDVSDNKFYLKAVFPKVQTEVRKGDVVQIGLVVSNSEVGAGSLSVVPMIYRLVCLNGMIMPDYGTKRTHIGRRNEADENVQQFLTDQTRRLDDAAFFAKTRDTVRGLLSNLTLERIVQKMRDATEQPIPVANINEVVEVTAEKFGYNEKTKGGILAHLIEDGDFTRYGLMNALTRQSQDEEDYELATQLETDGGRIIELARTDWKRIAEAA